MSDKNKLDGFLQQSLGDYSPDVPPHIWENIAAERKKKKPVAFWLNKKNLLLLGAALLLAGGTGYFYMQKNNTENISLETNGNSQPGTGNTVPAAIAKNDAALIEKSGNSVSPEDISTTAANETASVTKDKVNATATAADNTAGNNGVKKNTLSKAGNGNRVDANTNTDNANNLFRNRDKKGQHTKSRTRSSNRVSVAEDVVFNSDDDNADAGNQPLQQDFAIPFLEGSKERISIASLAALNTHQTVIKAIKIPDCPAAEKDAAGNKSYFEVYAGPDYAFKKYSDTANSGLVAKRKESLRFQSAYSAGVRYTRVFGNGMSFRTGFNYSQINEKFSFIKDNVVQQVFVINLQGDTTSSYYVRGTRYKTSYNHYRTLDVPLVVGYEMGNGRLHANINAGVLLNIYSWQKGETLDNNYMPVSITTGKGGDAAYQYKTNVGVGFTGAVSLYYKLNDRLHLLAEPYCRFNLSPMNKEASSLQEKFATIGLRLGLRVDF